MERRKGLLKFKKSASPKGPEAGGDRGAARAASRDEAARRAGPAVEAQLQRPGQKEGTTNFKIAHFCTVLTSDIQQNLVKS